MKGLLRWGLVGVVLLGCDGRGEMEEPTPLYGEVPVQYPLDLWDAGVEGETLLRVRVTEVGEVDSVEVPRGSGYPALDSAAVRGARELRYTPARVNGRRISVWAKVPVHFRRDDGKGGGEDGDRAGDRGQPGRGPE